MKTENIYNSDGTHRSYPHGASIDYPIGTIWHIKVRDFNCKNCPCFVDNKDAGDKSTTINCSYPHFTKAPN